MSVNEIRTQLAKYLARGVDKSQDSISIEQFEDWIAQNTWNIHQGGEDEASALAYEIEAKLAEYSGGHIDEGVLRSNLLPLVTSYVPKQGFTWAWNRITQVPFPFAVSVPRDALSLTGL
jgi:hypothetical protein